MTGKKFLIALAIFGAVFLALIGYALNVQKSVSIEHQFNVPLGKVWNLFNDPEEIKKWWGPKDYNSPLVLNDLRVGGSFLFAMQGSDKEIIYNSGQYSEIVEEKLIVARMSFSDKSGTAVAAESYNIPGKWPAEVEVRINFEEQKGGTHVTLTEHGIPMIMYFFAKIGWSQQFEKMDEILKNRQ